MFNKNNSLQDMMNEFDISNINHAVLDVMLSTDRSLFTSNHDYCYHNIPIPIACQQTTSQPEIIAIMTTMLNLNKNDKVLEIGTGSGYHTAIIAKLCHRIYSIERHLELHNQANNIFAKLNINNAIIKLGDGSKGWEEQAPFNKIIFTAAIDNIPIQISKQLSNNGIIIAPIKKYNSEKLYLITKKNNQFIYQPYIDVKFLPVISGIAKK